MGLQRSPIMSADFDESKLDKEYFPDGYFVNNKKQIIPRPMNWKFFKDFYSDFSEALYPKFVSEITSFGPEDEIIAFASISWYKDAGKILLERANATGIVFTIRQITKIAHIYGDKVTLALLNKTLDKGENLTFKDIRRLYDEVSKETIDKVVDSWISKKLPLDKEDLYSLDEKVDDYILARALKYAQDKGMEVNKDDFMKFVSYLPEKHATEIITDLFIKGAVFSKEEIFYLDGCVNESALSRAVTTCPDIFTLSDFNDLDGSVTRACLIEIAEKQGGKIYYDTYKGFCERED